MHFSASLPLISIFALLASHIQANPTKRDFCVGSANPIFKITNLWFQKLVFTRTPDVATSCSVVFDFADTYHGSSTKCFARYENCGAITQRAEPEFDGTFDGSRLFDCDDGGDTKFRFWENGRLDLVHRWTCDTPGGFAPR